MPEATVIRYSVSVSAYDNCDCRRTFEALHELGRIPESRSEAIAVAEELTTLLAADGYNERIRVRIDAYTVSI